jgi:crotonobetainyl-CoA:carnitine CoA-transferase CaiB-like acyl-CoA transferase
MPDMGRLLRVSAGFAYRFALGASSTTTAAEAIMRGGPLAGIRVIDLTTVVLGPFATQTLGDLGADVIKVESPEGDNCRWIGPCRNRGMGSYFAMLNRNKRGIVLDLKRAAARDALLHLVDGADVFVHNMRPGAAERLGLGYAALSARNPRLVYASASGFRTGSSKQEHPAFDDLIQGMSGMAALNAGADGAPRYVPSVIVDKLTGQTLASMIGMALFHRERTGQGQEVHVPMFETMLSFLLVEHMWGAVFNQPEQGLGYPRMLTPHRRPYATKDGYVSVIAVSDAHWSRLFAAIGRATLIDDPRFATIAARSDNVDALYAVLTDGMRERGTAEWLVTLRELDIPCGAANTLDDLLDDAYLRETQFFQPARHPLDGDVTITAIAARFSASPASVRRLWPALGEHTEEVLREAGYDDGAIAAITGG